jgi:hypothetical protein
MTMPEDYELFFVDDAKPSRLAPLLVGVVAGYCAALVALLVAFPLMGVTLLAGHLILAVALMLVAVCFIIAGYITRASWRL